MSSAVRLHTNDSDEDDEEQQRQAMLADMAVS
eukprot:CAMPEP_0176351102 /NCGR_PEP_ID=MMETSP0126-20121128/9972_1 /TAXON_ID=141414 ORGANISM="Strombidinopsis acuminatum, Strain SPMC142" /NCGR_SAMPLE_ID=MMETSP0126 /ASSEMBLY_ACC=CAM_ASM_000229 /LENGTH=31 /DNA_ID= /DNA_START= /DNA_END= /DNA_ORIENTATION=